MQGRQMSDFEKKFDLRRWLMPLCAAGVAVLVIAPNYPRLNLAIFFGLAVLLFGSDIFSVWRWRRQPPMDSAKRREQLTNSWKLLIGMGVFIGVGLSLAMMSEKYPLTADLVIIVPVGVLLVGGGIVSWWGRR
jgi:hypothetical protein